MVKLIRKMVASEVRLTFNVLVLHSLLLLSLLSGHVEARQRGDDIIMTKGKLIMRGGKGKGKRHKSARVCEPDTFSNFIIDTLTSDSF